VEAGAQAQAMTLSVIIITKNEAANIGACIDSVAFADEIIVVDSGSSDDTRRIAADKGAKVSCTDDWPGFGPQKNRALDLATGDWILSIDADERVTEELAAEIRREMAAPRADAYKIPRLSDFCGRWIRHSGWWPDYVLRLFRRGTARFTDAAVHESLRSTSTVANLHSHFLHYPYADLETYIAKINRYSTDAAAMMHAKGRRTSLAGATGHAVWTFVRHYVVRRGFLDGKEGFVLAVMAAMGSFIRYNKLILLNKQNN
jgi:glycosyltransferase involved in cell wall biosynthesis